MKLTFLGGAGTVTGSRTLVEAGAQRLLVDAGLFQGWKTLRLRNREPLPLPPPQIGAVLLTHAHLDHSGWLPRLVRDGWRGRIWCTPATLALARILLPDAAHLQEEDAAYANRKGYSRHHPAEPLYTADDARRCLEMFQPVPYDAPFDPLPGVRAALRRQGHILGAARVELEHGGQRVVFSGDIGRPDDPVMRPPEPLAAADWIVCESTYGDREHARAEVEPALAALIVRTAARGGVVVVPAFAVARAQTLLHHIARLKERGAIPPLPVYLDSPMAIDVTLVYRRFRDEHRLSDDECRAMCSAATFVADVEGSKRLSAGRGPMVIISASGMATGGRVLHHLKAYAPDHRNTIVLAGFQTPGTRGAQLAGGAQTLRIHGADVPVRAEVVALEGASAHADAGEIVAWLRSAPRAPRGVILNHGEPAAADALRLRIERELGWPAWAPLQHDAIDLASGRQAPG